MPYVLDICRYIVCVCVSSAHKAYEGEIRFLLNENKMSEI